MSCHLINMFLYGTSPLSSCFIKIQSLYIRCRLIKERWKKKKTYQDADAIINDVYHSKSEPNLLSSGGEFLTFIWILYKHVEIGDIFDIIVGNPRNYLMMVKELLLKIKLHLHNFAKERDLKTQFQSYRKLRTREEQKNADIDLCVKLQLRAT
ncbi:hypothetical protein IEQ34_001286 [Dendrobium chrysotoxum]|uniref:Uncharacterized protein n=1 Tax=Dendrobium chrysotoxum TaxID=161865 RepID=A0AAV7HQD2_DENCH|nr:hypothetical protein IEQ34_001286 [Dendrobium chrysotoxum]